MLHPPRLRQNGKESLKNTKYYSAEYKLKVIKRHFEDGISVADLTRETGIQYRMLKQWFQDYQKRGAEGLSTRKRGRPGKPQPNTAEEKIRRLETENEVLRAFLEECERWDAKSSGGLILHSDNGFQYTSQAYYNIAKANGIKPSMSSVGCPYDNACAEKLLQHAEDRMYLKSKAANL